MVYRYPHYYRRFHCIASDCPDTCCASWEIGIDGKSLERYRHVPGSLGNRLHNSIDWRRHSFRQYEGRCEFLNDEKLCDLYTELGEKGFCRACRLYPRHIEEFEGVREVSLCLSCIEAARIILETEEPVRILTKETDREETYEDFDVALYRTLVDARTQIMEILQDRATDERTRMGLSLLLAHDLQRRIRGDRLSETDSLLERYRRSDRAVYFVKKMTACEPGGSNRYETMKALLCEQLMGYWVFAYFCGAVYDRNAYGKMKFAVACTLLIEDMCQAVWQENGETLVHAEIVDIAHQFSREIEHVDENRESLERALTRDTRLGIRALLCAVWDRADLLP
ncbi:MAG: flagellin lysine-N-methylase [Clostridiales bacterium]|nr:flagellin lysine-N-methylase [Clostridiales bacterium]